MIDRYHNLFKETLESYLKNTQEPKSLYNPIEYILNSGGKRIRPTLVYLGAELFDGDLEYASPIALSIELFHNFTLIHDDIMDKAQLRRGKPTVHSKWDTNTAILSGDTAFTMAYTQLFQYPNDISNQLLKKLTNTAKEVCEGQQMDMDFEKKDFVSIEDYLLMIRKKTAYLLATALQMGGITTNTDQNTLDTLFKLGLNMGLAFQIQDDYLDAFGDDMFGKKIGGDIIAMKKTILYLYTYQLLSGNERTQFVNDYQKVAEKKRQKIDDIKSIFLKTGADKKVLNLIKEYQKKIYLQINNLNIQNDKNQLISSLCDQLTHRKI